MYHQIALECDILMTSINGLLNLIKENYSLAEVYSLLTRLSIHHRLQGSTGIWRAVNEVKEFLENNGLETKTYTVMNGEKLDLVTSPIGWDLKYSEVIIRENERIIAKYNTIEHPTLIAAHSPGGSDSGKIVLGGLDKLDGLDGDVLLTSDSPYLVYDRAVEKGFKAIIWYNPSRNPLGVPYTGLFFTPEEWKRASIPVITLPYKVVSRIVTKTIGGSRLSIEWNISIDRHEKGLPILETCLGNGEYIIAGVAHICHPKPGAHDNASGSATLAGNAVALARIFNKIDTNTRLCLYWVPEYTGTIALFKNKILSADEVVGVLNLDMVGSKQDITGSTLHIMRSMIKYIGALTPLTRLAVEYVYMTSSTFHGQPAIGSIRFDETPYGNGSDHDVFLVNNIEGVMLNEWPSLNYHTDLDTPDTIGYREIHMIGLASSLALSLSLNPSIIKGLADYVRNYFGNLITWYAMEAVKRGLDRSFVESRISKLLGSSMKKAIVWVENRGLLSLETPCCTDYPKYMGVSHISIRTYSRERDLDYRLVQKYKPLSMLISTYYPAYLNGLHGINDIIEFFAAEELVDITKFKCYGSEGIGCVKKLLNIVNEWLMKKGLIKK
ncbi:MAG: hypothetical protein DRO40_03400 [Thermoprotei archaeon]|nr:MAG: hypothetical protein DRO40_03400 [Thermoprotei archaeon]